MKIVIDLTSLSYHITGIERYALCITEQMLKIDSENTYILVFRNEIYKDFLQYVDSKRIFSKILKGDNKLLFNQVILPFFLYTIKAERYLFFAFTSPILFRKRGIFNTIHDMGPWDVPQALKKLQCFYLKTTCRFAAYSSQGIITVSEFSKKRINEILKIQNDKIAVIPPGITERILYDTKISYEKVKNKYNLPDKYIMSLSTLEPRKNLILLLQAYTEIMDQVDYDLVLVGRNGWKMNEVIERYKTQSRIHLIGFVEDAEVSQIYKNALCFVFPSLYEGFGIPPIEALALGSPVIASNVSSIPEVLMDRAMYFENNNKDELKQLLINLEKNYEEMSKTLNEYQVLQYDFKMSAKKVIKLVTSK